MSNSKVVSRLMTIIQPVLKYPIKNAPWGLVGGQYPNVELRTVGDAGTYGLAFCYRESASASTVVHTVLASNGNSGLGSLTTRSTAVIMTAGQNSVSINAPSVSGYTFLCWLGSASSGSIKMSYIENMLASNTKIWTEIAPSTNINFTAFALYRKGLNA